MRAFKQSPVAIAALLALGAAHAQPVPTTLPVLRPNGAVVNATVGTPANNTLTINQTVSSSNRALIEWSSFSIGSQAAVNITQPNAQSVLINRVVGAGAGPSASEIYGTLSANGRVFLLNPGGVIFGPTAQVNVGSLVATTLDLDPTMDYARVMRGDDLLLTATSGTDVQVMAADDPRRPQIRVTEGGSIVLLATANVVQDGGISAPAGRITLTTGGEALVRPVGSSGFVQLAVTSNAEARTTGISLGQGSQTVASGGSIAIGNQPRDENTSRADIISIAGTVSTDSSTGAAGSVHVETGSSGDVTMTEGAVVTSSSTAAAGGDITVLGGFITLQRGDVAHPRLLADGRTGGGRIDVGDTQTRAITLDTGTLLSADATGNGDGGRIRVRAMFNNPNATSPIPRGDFGVTEAYGTLRARGGTEGGNGGSIETSGLAVATALDDGGIVRAATIDARARAAGGRAGSWTLDPYDVTISSSAPVAVNGSFNPTGPGANVQASDLTAALDAGTNIDISTDAGGAGTQAGNITFAPGTTIARNTGTAPTSLTLRANGNIVIDTSTIDASRAGPVNINLYSDLDGNGTGSVLISNSTLRTSGGNLTVSGGIDPTTGYARGTASTTAGVGLIGSTIDTVGTASRGDVVLRGQAAAVGGSAAGVNVASSLTLGNLTIDGRASHGTAVTLNGASITTASGLVDVRGIATRVDTLTANLIGIDTGTAAVQLGTGSMRLAGRGDDASITTGSAVGLRMGDLQVSASTASTGTVTLAGQSTGGSIAAGIQNQISGNSGLVIRSNGAVPTSAATGANVVIGALADIRASSLELGAIGLGPNIATTGGVNIRPLGVSATGALVEQPTVPITLRPTGSNFGAGTFVVSAPLLQANSISAGLGTVIGSQGHTGAIVVDNNTFTSHTGVAVTLQNEGAGSAGITLGSGNTLGNLALLTAGSVSQAASGVSVQNLVVRGGAASTVNLNSTTNQITGNLAFDPPASLTVRTGGGMTIGAATAQTFDAASSTFAPLAITTSLGGNTALLQAGGAVAVNQPIQMTGTGATTLDIVSPTSVTFAAGATLTSASSTGRWNVWAPSVVNAPVTGSTTNLYGCVFGDGATCSVSGITRPTSGNQLLHPTQPTLTVNADALTAYADLALPNLTYSVSGLVNGDTSAQALSGLLAATPTASQGLYSIGAGTLASPTGYTLAFTGSTLTLRPGITRHMLQSAFQTEIASDVYGSNLDQPYICTAASVVRGGLAAGGQSDPLASEWGKVRNQPQLSGCLNVTDGGSCSAF